MHLLLLRQIRAVQLRKRDPKGGSRIRDSPGSQMKTKLHICYICVGGIGLFYSCSVASDSVSVSPYGSRLVDFVGLVVVTLTSLAPLILPLPQDSPSSTYCLAVGLCMFPSVGGLSLSDGIYARLLSASISEYHCVRNGIPLMD